ncbi:hypothetical protein ACFQZR_23095 [Paenibacillus sp. GCM10027629]|uniref:hypothetical protein n=1 Tax=Paenibacillus sp. GCM10027629 TaxID=3273414 RepID=UPI00362F53E1
MTRVYPEQVTASMIRVIHDDEVLLIRHSTEIHFGESDDLLGIAVMTNPGKFEFSKTSGWSEFKLGIGPTNTFEARDYPDLSMQNVIQVIRSSYESAGLSKPNGILRVYNLSNIRQPDGQKAEIYHSRAKHALPVEKLSLLEDPITHSRECFLDECNKSRFVIMGFVDGAFNQKMKQLCSWSEEIEHLACAIDDKGRHSHPRRWRTDPKLMNQAVESLKSVLQR